MSLEDSAEACLGVMTGPAGTGGPHSDLGSQLMKNHWARAKLCMGPGSRFGGEELEMHEGRR